jgi:hypothetical protein
VPEELRIYDKGYHTSLRAGVISKSKVAHGQWYANFAFSCKVNNDVLVKSYRRTMQRSSCFCILLEPGGGIDSMVRYCLENYNLV